MIEVQPVARAALDALALVAEPDLSLDLGRNQSAVLVLEVRFWASPSEQERRFPVTRPRTLTKPTQVDARR